MSNETYIDALELELDALGLERDAWKARAEQAETGRLTAEGCAAETRNEHAAIAERLRQAEKERDDYHGLSERLTARLHEAEEARERAEADNAALLDLLKRAAGVLRDLAGMPLEADFLLDTVAEPRPGAALLERLRALEAVHQDAPHANSCPLTRADIYLKECTCWKRDALRERKP